MKRLRSTSQIELCDIPLWGYRRCCPGSLESVSSGCSPTPMRVSATSCWAPLFNLYKVMHGPLRGLELRINTPMPTLCAFSLHLTVVPAFQDPGGKHQRKPKRPRPRYLTAPSLSQCLSTQSPAIQQCIGCPRYTKYIMCRPPQACRGGNGGKSRTRRVILGAQVGKQEVNE